MPQELEKKFLSLFNGIINIVIMRLGNITYNDACFGRRKEILEQRTEKIDAGK